MIQNEHMQMLLAKLRQDKDLKALLQHCAEWTADEIGEYRFKPLPIFPQWYQDFLEDPNHTLFGAEYYRDHPEVLAFAQTIQRIKNENRAIYEWLKECRGRLSSDTARAALIDEKLQGVTVEMLR